MEGAGLRGPGQVCASVSWLSASPSLWPEHVASSALEFVPAPRTGHEPSSVTLKRRWTRHRPLEPEGPPASWLSISFDRWGS